MLGLSYKQNKDVTPFLFKLKSEQKMFYENTRSMSVMSFENSSEFKNKNLTKI